MPTVNAIRAFEPRAFEPPPVPPFAEYGRRRSSANTTISDSLSTTLRSPSAASNRSKISARPKSAKFSSYRLRSNSGLSLHTNEDILRQYTDYYPDGSPRVAMYGNGNGQWSGDRLKSINSIPSSQRSSMAFTEADTFVDLPVPDFVGREMFEMVMKDPAASSQLWKYAASRGVGQNVDYLMKVSKVPLDDSDFTNHEFPDSRLCPFTGAGCRSIISHFHLLHLNHRNLTNQSPPSNVEIAEHEH